MVPEQTEPGGEDPARPAAAGVPETLRQVAPAAADLRRLTPAQLAQVACASLRDHLAAQARVARAKYAPLAPARLEALLADPECLRYPTRLLFEFGSMASHQFAQPEVDTRDPGANHRVLYLRPMLRQRPDFVVRAVAYMIPVINYGEVVPEECCLQYGAALLDTNAEAYYGQICALADWLGAEARLSPG